MNAEILCVGTELLLGDITNTNAQFISNALSGIGVNVYFQTVCGDNRERLKASLEIALSRSDAVIMTGGLGPTYDDLTKETIAEHFGLPLEEDHESLERIKSFFDRVGRKMTDNNVKQAYMPKGAVILKNDWGTAPGCMIEKDGKLVIMLPGPPREMKPMFEAVLPKLAEKTGKVIISSQIRLYGIGESAAENKLASLMTESRNPTIAPYAKDGEVLLRVTAAAESEAAARNMLKEPIDKIRREFGDLVYGIDVESLWHAAFYALKEKGLKVACAESCTGGMFAQLLTSIPGSSAVFDCGVISYSNDIKKKLLGVSDAALSQYGAVSEQVAKEMAQGIKSLSGADIGVGITGIAGPDGGSAEKPVGTVFVAAAHEGGCEVRKLSIGRGGNERELVRHCSCLAGFDMVRRIALAKA